MSIGQEEEINFQGGFYCSLQDNSMLSGGSESINSINRCRRNLVAPKSN
jgi:hypothetical protein